MSYLIENVAGGTAIPPAVAVEGKLCSSLCKVCGEEFLYIADKERFKYCDPCREKYKGNAVNLAAAPCAQCGKSYWSTTKISKFCSRRCTFDHRIVNNDPNRDAKYLAKITDFIKSATNVVTVEELRVELKIHPKTLKRRGWTIPVLYELSGKTIPDKSFSSVFEGRVHASLVDLGIEEKDIECQKTFSDLKGLGIISPKPLRFDFFIGKYKLLVEADGNHHYSNRASFYSEDNTIRDKKKEDYAEKAGLNIVRIKYKPTFAEVNKQVNLKASPFISK